MEPSGGGPHGAWQSLGSEQNAEGTALVDVPSRRHILGT